jgi:urease accessory protein UreE
MQFVSQPVCQTRANVGQSGIDMIGEIPQAQMIMAENSINATTALLVERAIGRLECAEGGQTDRDPTVGGSQAVDWIDLTLMQCQRRALRTRSRGGQEVKILLQLGEKLQHGDIVWPRTGDQPLLAINILPMDLIVGRSSDATQLALLAFALGNLHMPIELRANEIIAPNDGPVLDAFEKSGIAFSICRRRFNPSAMGDPGASPALTVSQDFRLERK